MTLYWHLPQANNNNNYYNYDHSLSYIIIIQAVSVVFWPFFSTKKRDGNAPNRDLRADKK